ncbi:MAG: Thioredoxin reductase [Candidatus Moranbacteria bacterium GW2011_GWC2_45_10]|nr:MAG: Thioredoxin reductase [Candidatus Moranbacteria bacterium GW2011_GWC2_45_10]
MLYDLVIIGAGPAGLSASVYASRYGVKNIVIGGVSGGVTTQTHEIGNWLGTQKIKGYEFASNAAEHVKSYGAEIVSSLVDEIVKKGDETFSLSLSNGQKVEAKTVIIALGTRHRHLGVTGEKEFAGKGVSYCATCDGFFYKGKTVAVVGGNDSAAGAAVFLGDIAEKVYMIYRKDELRAERFWVGLIEKNPKIKVLYSTNIKEISGNEKVEGVTLDSVFDGSSELKVDGIFVEIGSEPNVELIKDLGVDLDEDSFIRVGPDGILN